ncbi:MAG: 50S ribosomal protein L23 [Bacilli bacterium]|jgi:large subunit ribosomal protein L23
MAKETKRVLAKDEEVKATSTKKVEKAKPASKKQEIKKPAVGKATIRDFDLIIEPIITEKSMALIQEKNQVTIRVQKNANKANVKKTFEKVFGVKVEGVRILNVPSKETTRGGRYKGVISGYKKAIVTIAEGEALDLFKE